MANETHEQKKRETERGREGEFNPRREGDQKGGGSRHDEKTPQRGGGHPGEHSE